MTIIGTPDYQFMLESAKEHLDNLPELYNNSLSLPDIPNKLKNEIRYFLADIESVLDYISYAIFNKYCVKYFTDQSKIEKARKMVNFPLFDDYDYFHKRIDKMFIGLSKENPKLIKIFEGQQPFVLGDNCWLKVFNRLVNINKHRMLEKQTVSTRSHIHFMEDAFGNTFKNVTFENNGADINYGGHSIKFAEYKPNPFIKTLNMINRSEFIFSNTSLSVLPTLRNIYENAENIVNDVEKVAELNT